MYKISLDIPPLDTSSELFKVYSEVTVLNDVPDSLREYSLAKAEKKNNFRTSIDLFPFFGLLVSATWNKNLDVFTNKEMWRARNTPENKPLNYMHIQENICGHIVHNIVTDNDLNPIPDDTKEDDLPEKIHIVTANVLYSVWEDKKKQQEINDVIAKINASELFLSMEALFKSFDYALANDRGEQKFIERNPQTNYLTKFL